MFPQQQHTISLNRQLFLQPYQARDLAAFLSGQRRPDGITPSRWDQLVLGTTQWVGWRDLGAIVDAFGPEILDLLK